MPYIGEAGVRPYQDAAAIAADPAYGQIVCHCERVTRGEIRDALASRVPPADLGGLRRRTRAGNGRCQGFYCGAAVSRLLAGAGAGAGAGAAGRDVVSAAWWWSGPGRPGCRPPSSCDGSAPALCWWPTGRNRPAGCRGTAGIPDTGCATCAGS